MMPKTLPGRYLPGARNPQRPARPRTVFTALRLCLRLKRDYRNLARILGVDRPVQQAHLNL